MNKEINYETVLPVVKAFAIQAHKEAGTLYGGIPYEFHLEAADYVRKHFGLPGIYGWAVWLHDTIEDCPGITKELIEERFGEQVALLVDAVTDGQGTNRAERKKVSYAKMLALPEAILVKMCDRIANVQACLLMGNDSLFGMYHKEHAGFCEALQLNEEKPPLVECYLRPMLDLLNRLIYQKGPVK